MSQEFSGQLLQNGAFNGQLSDPRPPTERQNHGERCGDVAKAGAAPDAAVVGPREHHQACDDRECRGTGFGESVARDTIDQHQGDRCLEKHDLDDAADVVIHPGLQTQCLAKRTSDPY